MKENPFLGLEALYAEPETRAIRQQMVAWMTETLGWVDDALTEHPPAWPEPAVRRQALFMLDEPLHVLSAPVEPGLNDFLNRRIAHAVAEIEAEIVTHGMTLWKLYNHGFVVKTPEVTVGFDLHRGPYETFCIDAALFDRVLDLTQALFISHEHSDHADAYTVARMAELGRPVVVPPGLWAEEDIDAHLTKPPRHPEIETTMALNSGELTYRVFPGHQGVDLLNNVYLVSLPGGLQVMHTGDQANTADFTVWIDSVHEHAHVDVLMPNCWSTDLPRLIRGVSPRLVITGHENEMSHPVDHREAFSKTYGHLVEVATPVLVMAWGERFHYAPDDALLERRVAREVQPDEALTGLQAYLAKF